MYFKIFFVLFSMFLVFSLMLLFMKHLRMLLNNNLHMKCITENKSSSFLQIKKISYQIYFDLHFLFFMQKRYGVISFLNPALCHPQIAVLLTLPNRVIDRCV